ncbi:MAG TPA: hypothetical protein VKF82_12905 [Candidatus Eremiobacteraceae bacterium]|nr:hypothetical protein [Candidatus Eremiobacteraceae bacterium]
MRFLFVVALLAIVSLAPPARALAANALTPSGYLQYTPTFGDTYNGVTTDDGDHLSGSYSAKAQAYFGRFSAAYLYYRDLSTSQANGTTASGAPGTVISYPAAQVVMPVFTASDAESEIRLEYQPVRIPVYFGLAYSNSFNNYGFPRLTAFGVGVELAPNPKHLLSPYGSFYYFPNQTGTYPLADPNNPASGSVGSSFRANELDLGGSLAFPKTALSLVVGYYQTTNVRRTGTFNFVRDGPYVGLGYRVK